MKLDKIIEPDAFRQSGSAVFLRHGRYTYKMKYTIYIIATAINLVALHSAFALGTGLITHTTESSDHNFIYAYVSPRIDYESSPDPFSIESVRKMASIREKYKISGIFRTSDSKLLWPIAEPPDGEILLRNGENMIGGFTAHKKSDRCLAFYSKGKIIKQYSIKDLVSFPFYCKLVSCWGYEWRKDESFDENAMLLQIRTETWDRYTFNPITGEIVSCTKSIYVLYIILAIILSGIIFLWYLIKKRKYNKAAACNPALQDT